MTNKDLPGEHLDIVNLGRGGVLVRRRRDKIPTATCIIDPNIESLSFWARVLACCSGWPGRVDKEEIGKFLVKERATHTTSVVLVSRDDPDVFSNAVEICRQTGACLIGPARIVAAAKKELGRKIVARSGETYNFRHTQVRVVDGSSGLNWHISMAGHQAVLVLNSGWQKGPRLRAGVVVMPFEPEVVDAITQPHTVSKEQPPTCDLLEIDPTVVIPSCPHGALHTDCLSRVNEMLLKPKKVHLLAPGTRVQRTH